MRRQARLTPGLLLTSALLASPALAQRAPAPPDKPWRLTDAIPAPDWLKLSGSVRARYETLGETFYAGRTGGDDLFSVQTLLKAEAHVGDLALIGELLDSRRLRGDGGGGAAGEVDAFEPVQLFLAWRPKDFLIEGANLDLNVGRFTMDIGSRRLVARANYRNLLVQFDGVRAAWATADTFRVTTFYVSPAGRAPADAASALENEIVLNPTLDHTRFAGADVEATFPFSMIGEIYLLDLDEDDAAGAATRNRDLSTLGARLRRGPAKAQVDFDLEYANQKGTVRATTSPADVLNLDHDAHMFHAEIGFSLAAAWSPRLAIQFDHASGDRSPLDLSSGRFDPLFGDRSFEFGPTSIYGAIARTNLASPGIRFEVKPDGLSDAYVMVRQIELDQPRDSFGNTSTRDASGTSGKDVGAQIEGRYRRWLVQDSLRLSLGAAALLRGDFMKNAPNAAGDGDALFAFGDVTWTF